MPTWVPAAWIPASSAHFVLRFDHLRHWVLGMNLFFSFLLFKIFFFRFFFLKLFLLFFQNLFRAFPFPLESEMKNGEIANDLPHTSSLGGKKREYESLETFQDPPRPKKGKKQQGTNTTRNHQKGRRDLLTSCRLKPPSKAPSL